ncbi:MAG: HNH endonuclease [Candidatus Doudnabacteria bacterium]
MDLEKPNKKRTRIPKENKVRSELQKEINSVCPFCENDDVGHFEIHHIDGNPSNNELNNLLLVCPTCHSKITKEDITLDQVIDKKISLMDGNINKPSLPSTQINTFNAPINKSIIGNNNKITIKNIRKPQKQKYPEGCIGFDILKANYVSHLITRYHEYQEYQLGKGKMNYAIFPSKLKSEFKVGKSRTIYHVPIERFDELSRYIQKRIDETMLGRIRKSRNQKNYSTFEEYSSEQNK